MLREGRGAGGAMKYQWEELSALGKWCVVQANEPPIVSKGRIKTPEGQGPKVRNVRPLEPSEEKTE